MPWSEKDGRIGVLTTEVGQQTRRAEKAETDAAVVEYEAAVKVSDKDARIANLERVAAERARVAAALKAKADELDRFAAARNTAPHPGRGGTHEKLPRPGLQYCVKSTA